MSHGVTEKALRDQEPILTKYFDKLIKKLQENCATGPVDLSLFFNLVTVDIIGDLTFGQSFGCLENSSLHVRFPEFVTALLLITYSLGYKTCSIL
jgi:hypothetical protein